MTLEQEMDPFQAVVLMNNLMNNHNLPKKPKSAHHQGQKKIDSRSELITPQPRRIFFAKRPKPASSHLPSVIVSNDEETSQKVTKQWTDPVRQKEKERRRLAQKKRRENQRPDTSKRTERRGEHVVGKIIDCQAARTGADMTSPCSFRLTINNFSICYSFVCTCMLHSCWTAE